MARKIQFKRGTAASWTSTDPTLAIGELGLETDTGKMKIGDGVTAWSARPYIDAAAVAHIADSSAAHAASAVASTPAGSLAATDVQAALNELDTEKAPLASPALTGTPTAPTAATATNTTQVATTAYVKANRAEQAAADASRILAADGRTVIQQPDYPVDVAAKNNYGAIKLLGYTGATANKAPLQLYSAKESAAGEDVLFSVDYAGNGFPGPITIIKTDGGIETGAYLKVSGHAKNSGTSAGYKEATYKRTMATIWTDTPGASETESNCVLSLRNVGAAYPGGDAGNCDVLLIVEDSADDVTANGKERLSIRPKGDIYQMFTTHTTDWANATNYERAHIGWDVANNRHVVETQAGGTGVRRELLVKDRKFLTASAPGSISATTNALIWPVPRACVIRSVKFSSLTAFTVNGGAFWRVAVTKYASGAYVGDIINVGNDSIALSSGATNDLGTPSATYGVLAAGDIMRVFFNKAVGSPAAIDCPTVVIEWEPT